ncbi:MAG: efflux RND transporter periplasmic adaptor subunit [Candidatus Zixiibacteriota bacterium]
MKKLVVVVPVLILAVLLIWIFGIRNEKSEANYLTAEAKKGDIHILVTATGTAEAVTTVEVGSQVSGTISALYVDFNDRVTKGQIVAQLDPTFLKAQVAQVQADLEKATASVNLSKKEYQRALSLFEKQMISESEGDLALTNYELALAQEKSARASLERAGTNLNYATIVSPIDGVVISRNVDVGQTVAASLQAPTLFTIARDLAEMQIETSIDEADIGRIREGQEAIFTVDAFPDQTFEATVSQIRLLPEIVQNVVTYDVILQASNPDLLLKPGMTANVTVLVDYRENVLKVPSGAFRFRPAMEHEASSPGEGHGGRPQAAMGSHPSEPGSRAPLGMDAKKANQATIWILSQIEEPEPILVQTGISDGSSTQIVSGDLKEGDMVIVGVGTSQSPHGNQQVNPFAPTFRRRGR